MRVFWSVGLTPLILVVSCGAPLDESSVAEEDVATVSAFVPREVARRGVPERIDLSKMTSIGGGGALTPDGRIVIAGWAYSGGWPSAINGWPQNTGGSVAPGWVVQVVRPEAMERDARGQPVFKANAFSPSAPGYLVEPGFDPDTLNATYGRAFVNGALPTGRRPQDGYPNAIASGVKHKAHTTWFPDPELDGNAPANPYACDQNGVPDPAFPAAEKATYIAYEMLAISFADYWEIFGTSWVNKSYRARQRQTPIKIVIKNPFTANATVHKAWVTGRAQDLTYPHEVNSNWRRNIHLAESSISVNGHFLVGQGAIPRHVASPPIGWVHNTSFKFDHIVWCSWNPQPGNPNTWHRPVLLSELFDHRNDILKRVDGVDIPLKDVVRLAAKRLRHQDGSPLGNDVMTTATQFSSTRNASFGAYPWVHWDGDGVMYPLVGSRGTLGYAGVRTNYTFTSLDAANISHLNVLKGEEHDKPGFDNGPRQPRGQKAREHVMQGMLAMTGMWDVYRHTGKERGEAVMDAHPAHPREPALAVVHGEDQKLVNVSLEDWTDGEFLAVLRMTPLVERHDVIQNYEGLFYRHRLDRAADTSANYHVATLKPDHNAMHAVVPNTGAAFTVGTSDVRPYYTGRNFPRLPYFRPIFDASDSVREVQWQGVVNGRIGEGVRLGRAGYIEIADGPFTPNRAGSLSSEEMTIEAFVKPTTDLLSLARSSNVRLFHHAGRYTVSITPSGALDIRATSADFLPIVGDAAPRYITGPVLTNDLWYHVAVSVGAGELRAYVDGAVVGAWAFDGPLVSSSNNRVQIGPNGTVAGSDEVLLFVDELRLSRVVRTQAEVRRHAFVEIDEKFERDPGRIPPLANTPVGVEDTRVDSLRPWTQAKSDLGAYLFFSRALSLNDDYSCASCHDPSMNFTDARALALGHAGKLLKRGTPTIFNVVTGERMFWDMRAEDLAEQATQPIVDVDEMGFMDLTTVINRLNADPRAMNLAMNAFGVPMFDKRVIEQSLESYMQAQIVPKNAADHYDDGTANALTVSEKRGRALFRGKARCVACHHGPSLTNNLAMNTGTSDGDVGRGRYTNRARDVGAFKTPTLRRATDQPSEDGTLPTAPYFHDGFQVGGAAVAVTLDQVVDFYNLGGGLIGARAIDSGRARAIGSTHESMMRLALSGAERADLLAFLRRVTQ